MTSRGNKRASSGGVADYFAVLGVGDSLIPKRRQKAADPWGLGGAGAEELAASAAAADEEEDCAFVERFYREVVEMAILTSAASDIHDGNDGGDADGDASEGGGRGGGISVEGDETKVNSTTTTGSASAQHQRGQSEQSMPTSPVESDAMSAVSVAEPDPMTATASGDGDLEGRGNGKRCGEPRKKGGRPEAVSGFTVVWDTVPGGGRVLGGPTMAPFGSSSAAGWGGAWKRRDADLNPSSGLRSALIISASGGDDAGTAEGGRGGQRQQKPRQGTLRGIGRRVGRVVNSTLRDRIVDPIIAAAASGEMQAGAETGAGGTHANALRSHPPTGPPPSPTFHLGYRRRGPDEDDRPAIANATLRYARIHPLTVVSPLPASGPSPPSSPRGEAVAMAVKDPGDAGGDRDDPHDLRGRAQRAAATALRRGIIAGVGLATRAAAEVRERGIVSPQRSPLSSPPRRGNGAELGDRVAEAATASPTSPRLTRRHFFPETEKKKDAVRSPQQGLSLVSAWPPSAAGGETVLLADMLPLPEGFDEWVVPDAYQTLRLPGTAGSMSPPRGGCGYAAYAGTSPDQRAWRSRPKMVDRTVLFPHRGGGHGGGTPSSEASGDGVEAYYRPSPTGAASFRPPTTATPPDDRSRLPWSSSPTAIGDRHGHPQDNLFERGNGILAEAALGPEALAPTLVSEESLPIIDQSECDDTDYEYIPLLAVRRQRVGDEERYHEDPAIIDAAVSFFGDAGEAIVPDDEEEEEEGGTGGTLSLLATTGWAALSLHPAAFAAHDSKYTDSSDRAPSPLRGLPVCLVRRNAPQGFADTPYATSVLDRFPRKNYKGAPMPEEELPMFCYPTGCRLHRARLRDAPLAQCYGFVVKNERGDSIHVSCVSFMEPLAPGKAKELDVMSDRRRRASIPHRLFCERREKRAAVQRRRMGSGGCISSVRNLRSVDEAVEDAEGVDLVTRIVRRDGLDGDDDDNNDGAGIFLTGFDDMTTFENKTICLVSQYPFWTAFRRFLLNLHVMSGSSSDLPLERCISHLLLTVPVPKPGRQCIIIPLPTLNTPMVLAMPPAKDLPLLDLPFQRMFACLDVPTVVTLVLGFLALERKVWCLAASYFLRNCGIYILFITSPPVVLFLCLKF